MRVILSVIRHSTHYSETLSVSVEECIKSVKKSNRVLKPVFVPNLNFSRLTILIKTHLFLSLSFTFIVKTPFPFNLFHDKSLLIWRHGRQEHTNEIIERANGESFLCMSHKLILFSLADLVSSFRERIHQTELKLRVHKTFE